MNADAVHLRIVFLGAAAIALLSVAVAASLGQAQPGGVGDHLRGQRPLRRVFRQDVSVHCHGERAPVHRRELPGGQVGRQPGTGKPYNGETLAYTLEGIAADSRHFATDAATGQIRVKQGVALDRETRSIYPDNTVESVVKTKERW